MHVCACLWVCVRVRVWDIPCLVAESAEQNYVSEVLETCPRQIASVSLFPILLYWVLSMAHRLNVFWEKPGVLYKWLLYCMLVVSVALDKTVCSAYSLNTVHYFSTMTAGSLSCSCAETIAGALDF